jgi:two-component system chemotaxis response regulator CheY
VATKILLIDDSKSVRQQLSLLLNDAGYETLEAEDGEQALDVIAANKTLAMAIADVNMPVMNGIEMLQKLRERNLAPDLPIVMLTTEAQAALIDEAKKAGAKAWIVKPVKPNVMLAAVRKVAGPP